MKIILIGFMGAGKTKISKLLGEKLLLPVIETDDLVLQQIGRKSIADIFSIDGEIRFRELEMDICKGLRNQNNIIISCGGGVIMNRLNIDYMKEHGGIVIYLKTSWEVILERCGDSPKRPLLKDKIKAKQLYELRQPLYQCYADLTIDRQQQTVDETVQQILIKLSIQ